MTTSLDAALRALALPALAALLPITAPMAQQREPEAQPGYTDTPVLPGLRWRVHDAERPRPPAVDPGPAGRPVPAPADALVLFDGSGLDAWTGQGGEARWKLVADPQAGDGAVAMEVNGTGGIQTREAFGDCQLHLEWCSPAQVRGDSQGRGNSGVFLMGRYEIQILDSYRNPTYADGQAAAVYGQKPPEVNACRPPGEWQTYDILFTAPRFDGDRLVSPAFVTVIHNGIVVQNHVPFLGGTAHRSVASYAPHAAELPISLQDHGDPVRFRNIWVRRLDAPRAAAETPAAGAAGR